MTRKSHPDNQLIRFGTYKVEVTEQLNEKFKEACAILQVTRTDVLRHLISDFIDEVKEKKLG